jgi:hypothetical protein
VRELLSGALAAFTAIAALRFWTIGRRTGDRFFDLFAIAFAILTLNAVTLGLTDPHTEHTAGLYVVRLAAFVLIVAAIWLKNRKAPHQSD